MKRFFLSLILSVLLALVSCSPISVKTDYDREVNFAKYRTFKWMPYPEKRRKGMVPEGSLLDVRIRRAVETELAAKDYEFKQSGPADAVLAYHVGIQEKVDVTGMGYRYWGYRRAYVHRYKEGTIIIDIVDPKLKQLVWRGAAVGALHNMNEPEEKINEAIFKIFEKYPPK